MKKNILILIIILSIPTYILAQFQGGTILYSANTNALNDDFEDRYSLDQGVTLSYQPTQKNWTNYRFNLSFMGLRRKALINQVRYNELLTRIGIDVAFLHDFSNKTTPNKTYFSIGIGGYYTIPSTTDVQIQGYDLEVGQIGLNAKMSINFKLIYGSRAEVGFINSIDFWESQRTSLQTISFKDAGVYIGFHISFKEMFEKIREKKK